MLFDEQLSRKPDLYPWSRDFIDAMWQGHWTPNEFNFQSDLHDYKVNLSEDERVIIKNTLSAIAQIEVAVKKFWARLGDNLPHPSINDLGIVMANVETLHNVAYEKLLTVLDLESVFEENLKLDIIKGRVNYLQKYNHKYYKDSKKQYIYSIVLFTLFVENVSLFSQFYVINWFNRFKNVLKDTAHQISYTNREECHLEGTEVLTPYGWVDFRDINIGDDVVQYNPDGTFSFTKILHKTENDFSGNLIRFHRTGNECIVTPEHDICYYDGKGDFVKRKAKDVKIHNQFHLPKGGILVNTNGTTNELSMEDRLKIAIQADGSNLWWKNKSGEIKSRGINGGHNYVIAVSKDRKKIRLEWILNSMGIEYSKKISNNGIAKYTFNFDQGSNYKEFDWVDLANKTSNWCKEFVDETVEWDRFKRENDNQTGYSSTNKRCIDIVQTAAILAGYITNVYKRVDPRKESYKDCYKVSFINGDLKAKSHGVKKTEIPYEGKVYCVTVPSGNIMTRLNENTFISGNCLHALAGSKIINVLREEYPELFDEDLENKILQEAQEAFNCESKIIDWIVGDYSDNNISADILKTFIKDRINTSLLQVGYPAIFHDIDEQMLEKSEWFNEDVTGNVSTDFFHIRPTSYVKDNKTYNEEDLF